MIGCVNSLQHWELAIEESENWLDGNLEYSDEGLEGP